MAKPSISMPDDLLAEFDALRKELKRSGDIDMDERRSQTFRRMMRSWMDMKEENLDLPDDFWREEGNRSPPMPAD